MASTTSTLMTGIESRLEFLEKKFRAKREMRAEYKIRGRGRSKYHDRYRQSTNVALPNRTWLLCFTIDTGGFTDDNTSHRSVVL